MSHVELRLKQRANITSFNYQDIVDVALEFGEEITYNKKGMVFRCRYQGKTIYPVIAFDNTLVTVLGEDMVKRIIKDEKGW